MPAVYLDSCVVIYLIQAPDSLHETIKLRLSPSVDVKPDLFVSELTRFECRVGPLRKKDPALLQSFDAFFSLAMLRYVPLSRSVFDLAADLRASLGFKTPDALHAAASIAAGCDEIWTNDLRLKALDPRIRTVIIGNESPR